MVAPLCPCPWPDSRRTTWCDCGPTSRWIASRRARRTSYPLLPGQTRVAKSQWLCMKATQSGNPAADANLEGDVHGHRLPDRPDGRAMKWYTRTLRQCIFNANSKGAFTNDVSTRGRRAAKLRILWPQEERLCEFGIDKGGGVTHPENLADGTIYVWPLKWLLPKELMPQMQMWIVFQKLLSMFNIVLTYCIY